MVPENRGSREKQRMKTFLFFPPPKKTKPLEQIRRVICRKGSNKDLLKPTFFFSKPRILKEGQRELLSFEVSVLFEATFQMLT